MSLLSVHSRPVSNFPHHNRKFNSYLGLLLLLLQYLKCPLGEKICRLLQVRFLILITHSCFRRRRNENIFLICRAERPTSQSVKENPGDNLTAKMTTIFFFFCEKRQQIKRSPLPPAAPRRLCAPQFARSSPGVFFSRSKSAYGGRGERRSKSVPAGDTRR